MYELTVACAIILVGLLAGFFFTFSVIIMPGLRRLVDKEYIMSFRAIDSVLQSSMPAVATRPVFGIVFIGAMLSVLVSAILGVVYSSLTSILLITGAGVCYSFGVLWLTARIHLPLNNQLQSLPTDSMSPSEMAKARSNFEGRWVRWNTVRTVAAIISFVLLLVAYKIA